MPLSEHVYCVAITFKVTEWVEQRICIRFCIKLEHSSMETIGMIQRATAMGSWWLAAWSQQHALSCITCLVQSFLTKHQVTQVTQPPYCPDLAPCNFQLLPKLKSPLKGKRFQTIDERFRKIWQGSWWQLGELCEVPRCLPSRGLRCHCPVYSVSCILYLLQ